MTDLEHLIMKFEDRWWRLAGSKESAICDELDMSPTRYYQLLQQLAQREDVLATYPVQTKRLRRRMSRTPARPRVGTPNLD
ncbi:hypothetical protein NCCP2495_05920 [Dietzia sp. NCCP-2495]|uniref:DUF3263 domain-containing protein n=1 Tax=Dietzia sp. NCCP-2495 TaxID=2934675 RepID=UPI002232AA69|nr:DUF3263 domain-containing protein [Dietzia sp. NCCP-2495]GLB62714.1 hypothetical protein NCCP2495_05920 [Dietzia sp. NCCP-2495]